MTTSRYVRHDSRSSLRTRMPRPAVMRARPTRRRKTSSSDGRTRSYAARRTRAATTRGNSSDDATSGIGHRHDEAALGLGDAVDPGDGPKARRPAPRSRPPARAQDRSGTAAGRTGQELVERPFGDESAVVQDADAIADPFDIGEHVGREDDRRALAELRDERQQVAPTLGVQRADRLVQDEQIGFRHERLGDARDAGASRPSSRRSADPPRRPARRARGSRRRDRAPRRRQPLQPPSERHELRPVIQP